MSTGIVQWYRGSGVVQGWEYRVVQWYCDIAALHGSYRSTQVQVLYRNSSMNSNSTGLQGSRYSKVVQE